MSKKPTMASSDERLWLAAMLETVAQYRRMIDSAVVQLSDEQFFRRPAPGYNSVAVLLRHLGGNLLSRWDGFLTEDGEKPTRDRDSEFEDWNGDRTSLIEYFDSGWRMLVQALASLTVEDLSRTVMIRGEGHTVPEAIIRSVTHVSYHVGQLMLIARMNFDDEKNWNWLTIQPGKSKQHNAATWGTPASRAIFGESQSK